MKILVINTLDERYGSTYRIRAIAGELLRRGEQVYYYEDQISFWVKAIRLIQIAMTGKHDIIILQKFNPLTFFPILISKIRKKYVIVDWDDWDTGLQRNFFLKCATWICEKFLPLFPDLITSHNQNLLDQAPSGKKKIILEQGYDPGLFPTVYSSSTHPHITTVGYLCTFTHGGTLDLEEIMLALSKVNQPEMRFVFIGGGDLLEHFQQKARDFGITTAEFTGFVPHENIASILQSLDLGLIYMNESKANLNRMSFKVIEYLASGLPVVGQAVGPTQKLFGSAILPCPIEKLPDYLNALTKATLPDKKDHSAMLKDFIWSKIIDKLHGHIITMKDS